MHINAVFDALQLAISPVILISACGMLLLTMTNRLGRAIDRAHTLVREKKGNRDVQLRILVQRARWIRSAILFTGICLFVTAILVPIIFLSLFLSFNVEIFIAVLFPASLLSLAVSLCYFIADIFSSLRAMEVDIQSIEAE